MDQQQLADLEVQAARTRLTARLVELENRVVGTTNRALDNVEVMSDRFMTMVTDTTSQIKDACSSVATNVCETFDVPRKVKDHPWRTLGLAAAVGLLVGLMPRRTSKSSPTAAQPGFLNGLLATLGREAATIGEALIVKSASAVKQNLAARQPTTIDRVTVHYPNGLHKSPVGEG
jgi:ElaB/YqjD/DUF883 family membrane-anchored ribosome-binding protein